MRTIEPALPSIVGKLVAGLGAQQLILHMGAAIHDRGIDNLALVGVACAHHASQ